MASIRENPMRNLAGFILLTALALAGCGEKSTLPIKAGMGPDPNLPEPRRSLLPTVNIAPAKGWAAGATPTPAPGLTVGAFASGLDHPRWLYVLPNGDVLVAETNAPPKPDDGKGIKGWVMKKVMARAGAAVPSANRITLLRDADGDGTAEIRSVFLENLSSPFGMALVGDRFYVANTDAVVQFPYKSGDTRISAAGSRVAELPAGTLNHHWTKNVIAGRDGKHLYVTVGSNSNVAENGMDQETRRAAVLEIDLASRSSRVYASGLRNPNGLDWQPQSGALWTVVNERDDIGNDLVPDYITSVTDGGFYGWPYSYFGPHVDERVQPPRPDLVATAIKPDYALGSHTGSLGLAFSRGNLLPAAYLNGAFVGQHGSWNRKPRSGYKVIFIPFSDGQPAGEAQDVLTDFVDADGKARGRPVGVAIDRGGALLVADDVGNIVWRVVPSPGSR
jgi:glucose/arabinose dehydrogenase